MKPIDKILRITIRFLELILILSISFYVVREMLICNDRPTLFDDISIVVVTILWLFPISIPLTICVIMSLIKSCRLKTLYAKMIFIIHLFNILSFLFLIMLPPNATEPTAQKMADNIDSHTKEMMNLINYVDSLANDCEGIEYVIINGKIRELSVKSEGEWIKKDGIETMWVDGRTVAGVTPYKLQVIDTLLRAANLQGVFFDNETCSKLFLYYRCGKTDFAYKIYKSKDAVKNDAESYVSDRSFIIFNDSIAFVRLGFYPSNGSFKDYEQFCHHATGILDKGCDKDDVLDSYPK